MNTGIISAMIRVDAYFRTFLLWVLLTFVSIALGACRAPTPLPLPAVSATSTAAQTASLPTATLTPPPPTPTPEPLVALVNGEPLTLADFQAELTRYQAAVGTQLATQDETRVLNDLIDRLLLAQAAAERGYQVGSAELDARIEALITRLGGEALLQDWFAANAYDMDSFRRDLGRDMAAAWMRDQIAAGIPEAVEQVHARQILLYNSDDADEVLAQLLAGEDFAQLAAAYDPVAAGDLGWFPKGYLLDPALNEAAFRLEPQEISPVIAVPQGYVILQLIERDPARPLEPDARLILQEQALQQWLAANRNAGTIEILLP